MVVDPTASNLPFVPPDERESSQVEPWHTLGWSNNLKGNVRYEEDP